MKCFFHDVFKIQMLEKAKVLNDRSKLSPKIFLDTKRKCHIYCYTYFNTTRLLWYEQRENILLSTSNVYIDVI